MGRILLFGILTTWTWNGFGANEEQDHRKLFNPLQVTSIKSKPTFSIGSIINNHTVLRGALRNWDPERLARKHADLDQIGGMHLNMITAFGDQIDGYYFNGGRFLAHLFEKSGQIVRLRFKGPIDFHLQSRMLATASRMVPVRVLPFTQENLRYFEKIDLLERTMSRLGLSTVQSESTGSMFAFRAEDNEDVRQNIEDGQLVDRKFFCPELQKLDGVSKESVGAMRFTDTSRFDEIEKMFDNLGLGKAGFIVRRLGKALYIFGVNDLSFFTVAELAGPFDDNVLAEQAEGHVQERLSAGGTIILSMNQTDIYEQYTPEILLYLFKGINVIVYNNSGKGLSIGNNARKNINAALEIAYTFAKTVLQVPDEKIVLKGQCFGAMPSAQIASKYPNVNLWIDQAGADMKAMAKKAIDFQLAKKDINKGRHAVSSVLARLFPTYHVAESLGKNRGHKLLTFNIPNNYGVGGDHLVYDEDIDSFINAINDSHKKSKLAYIPGGQHVTSWYVISYTRRIVTQFLDEIGVGAHLILP